MSANITVPLKRLVDERNRVPLFVGVNAFAILCGVASYLVSAPQWLSLILVCAGVVSAPWWLAAFDHRERSTIAASLVNPQLKTSQAVDTRQLEHDSETNPQPRPEQVTTITESVIRLAASSAADIDA